MESDQSIYHKGFNRFYQSIPFLWNYFDILMPFEVLYAKKINKDEIIKKIQRISESNNPELVPRISIDKFKLFLEKMDDEGTEFYINTQFKKQLIWYMNKYNREIYVSFHTWLYKKDLELDFIENDPKLYKIYNVETGVFPLIGTFRTSKDYPTREVYDKKGKYKLFSSGINLNGLSKRSCIIHYSNGYVKFSPFDECNFNINQKSENVVFISVVKSKIGNCVTLHILRNVQDDDPNNKIFQDILKLVNEN